MAIFVNPPAHTTVFDSGTTIDSRRVHVSADGKGFSRFEVTICDIKERAGVRRTGREGRVLGIEGPPKTMSSYRNIDMLDPLFEALRVHRIGYIVSIDSVPGGGRR